MAGSAWAEDHYLVGGCTASGWESGDWQRSPVAMVNVADNVWVWAGKLTVGDGDNGRFKIPNSGGGWDGYWAPEQGTVLGTEEKDLSTSSEGDNKYCVAEEGIYKVTINTSSLKIKAEKLTEPSKDGDYYLISSVADYYWFAGKVTSEGGALKARLTADLNFAEAGFFPLACDKFKFKGEFDGAGHTISNAVIIGSNNNVAFARYASDGANIHDFVIEGSFTGNAKVGGIIGFARDGGEVKLANIVNKASVQATGNTDANAAALVGCATDGTKITALNCANLGSVSGQDGQCAAFAGWTQSGTTFTNCWNNGTINNIDGTSQLYRNSGSVTAVNCYDLTGNEGYNQGEKLAASTLTTGELCYKLNGDQSVIGWRQNLTGDDADQIPVPFSSHAQVYANGTLKCDGTSAGGELTYANESSSVIPPHSYENGWCSVCGAFDKEYLTTDEDGFFSIGTANDLHWFATFVDKENQAAKAKLTANIDYSEFKQGFIGGSQAAAFSGVFDGQGKTITIDIVNDGTNRTGLFAYIKSATIKNLAVEGSATSAGNNCVGGLGGRSDGDGTLIENVVVKTAVSYTGSNGDATCGGFFANMEAKVTLRNCAFYGSINTGTSEGNGGLVGWAGGGTNSVYENCIVAPTSYTKNGNSADFARNNPTTTNCVKLEGDDARLATGEMTYILNGNQSENVKWYQKLGAEGDAHPMPFGTDIVYANGSLDCAGNAKEGTTVTYSNTDGSTRDEHQFTDGFCSACGQVDLNYIAATDGVYNLASAKDVKWFAAFVNSGNGAANACLTADIDFDGVSFTGIGNGANHYTGTFDGQRHIVKNMTIDLPEVANVGFFNEIGDGAVIKNFTIDASCSVKGEKFAGAFVGHASGNGTALLAQLGNEGSVETVNQNAGAIVGCNTSGELKLTIKNCYNTGAISSSYEAGGLSGWFGNDAITVNCYNMGTVTNGESFARGNNIQITNCFDPVNDWTTLNKVAIEDFTNGAVYAKLAEAAPYVWYLSAEEGGHPVLYKTQWGGQELSPYAGVEVQEGEEFYLYNVESGMWLQENNRFVADWNTHGELGTIGFDVQLIKSGEGWQINPKFGHNNSLNASNQYLDTGDAVTAWTFVPVETDGMSKAYYIKSGDNYLRAGDNDKLTCNGDAVKNTWQVVTRQQRIDYAKTATVAHPKDLSFLIRGNEFSHEDTRRQANWTISDNDNGGKGWEAGRFDDNRQNSVFEAWDMTKINFSQTVSGLPAGYYTVEARAAESPTGSGGLSRALLDQYNAGTLEQYGVLYANDATAKLPSIYSEQYSERAGHFAGKDLNGIWIIDGVTQFSYAVANKETAYKVATAPFEIAENGSIKLGVLVKDAPNKTVWMMVDKFRLNYLGTTLEESVDEYIDVLKETIADAKKYDQSSTTTVLANNLATAITTAEAALTATSADEVKAAISALKAALSAAQDVDATLLKKTVALAKAESVNVEAAEKAIAESTTIVPLENALNALRIARRVNAADVQENVFKGNEPAEGDFYLYNVGAKRFLCGADDWGAHCAVGFPGQLLTFTGTDGNFRIDTHLSNGGDNHFMGYNGYMDTNATTTWTLIPAGQDGVYAVARTDSNTDLLGYDTTTYNIVHTDRHDSALPENQWILVSVADRDALIAKATEENPVDVSYKIQNPGFDQRAAVDNWSMENFSIFGRGGNHIDFVCESYDTESSKLSQTLGGLKAGKYKVSMQGYYRDGDFENQVRLIAEGNEPAQLPKFYAGDRSILLPNIVTEKDKAPGIGRTSEIGEFSDGCDQTIFYFQLGLYKVELEVTVGEDGILEFGVSKDEKKFDRDWVTADNFRLTYLGDPTAQAALAAAKEALAALIATAKAIDTTGKTAESATALSTAISNAETALAAEDATVESLNAAKTALQNAIDGLKDEVVDGINVIEAAAKAGKVYNTQGQKVNKTQKGVYIINGKKTVVK